MLTDDATPIRRQYLEVKRRYPDAIVFFRLGDFYETFDGDAEIAARELEIVLTSRNVAKGSRVPMAGIPFHAAENYIARLINRGYHVAICEQVGDEPIKGLVPREVTRVVTPGTVMEPGLLPGDANNYLAALYVEGGRAGLGYVDITTGEFAVSEFDAGDAFQQVRHELERIHPSELIVPESSAEAFKNLGLALTPHPAWKFEGAQCEQTLLSHFGVASLAGFGLEAAPLGVRAAGAIVNYVRDTQPAALSLLTRVNWYSLSEFMNLDSSTRRNLELTESLGRELKGSLLGVLDRTVTPMGKRLLRQWVSQPLLDKARIEDRRAALTALHREGMLRAELTAALKPLPDLERLANRAVGGTASPRDLVAMREALAALPGVAELLKRGADPALLALADELDPCAEVLARLQSAISDQPPAVLSHPGVIRPGYSAELDGVVQASSGAREWIAGLERVERERAGIKSLKVGYNKVFGYYLEVTKANAAAVPGNYIRKQTLVNAERYITPELKEYETLVLNAEERILEIEARLFKDVCAGIAAEAPKLLRTARVLGHLDASAGLAEVAVRERYACPEITEEDVLEIRDGRHPVVEHHLSGERFVPNDTAFAPGERIQIITGPNMSGKSTYMRQVAVIVLMAQIGSFVPASSARIGLVDRIFTRIGAQDEIHSGRSTFMVEMVETARLLSGSTTRSLLVLDEIGRGTSTYDGLAIARAVIEYIHNHPKLGCKTLFATHYHELIELEGLLPGVRNYNAAAAEDGDGVVFLHKVVRGGADQSYGIHVASLAGIPKPVVRRAAEILQELEKGHGLDGQRPSRGVQIGLFAGHHPALAKLQALSVDELSPLEALTVLYELKRLAGGGK